MSELVIDRWIPTPLNKLLGDWRRAQRLKKDDRDMVIASTLLARLPKATRRRRVDLVVTLPKGQRAWDRDALWKSTLDSLKHAKLLVDDNPTWCVPGDVTYERSGTTAFSTKILLTDLEDA